jgi:protease-4
MIVAIILFVLLGFSVLLNIGGFFSELGRMSMLPVTRHGGPRLEEFVLEDNGASAKFAVVRIEGIISHMVERGGFNMVEILQAQFKRATEDPKVKAVLLRVDSPGGEVLASDEIARTIREFQEQTDKPVVACLQSLGASGGYYVAAPCRWIVANELTITGSIGVILSTWNYRGLMNKVGIRPFTFKSGRFKDMLSGSREPDEITSEEKEMVQRLVDEVYAKFKQVVAEGRRAAADARSGEGRALASNWTEFADGRVLSGREAYELGFVDELGSFETAVKRAQKLARVPRANLVEYRQRVDLSDLLGLFGQSEARTVKLELGLEPPKLEAGRLYFLPPTYVQ